MEGLSYHEQIIELKYINTDQSRLRLLICPIAQDNMGQLDIKTVRNVKPLSCDFKTVIQR